MATELVGIELELRGEEGVFRDMEKLDTMIRQLGGRHKIELELGKTKQRILELRGEINQTNREIDKMRVKVKEANEALREADKEADNYEELERAVKEANEELEAEREYLKQIKNEYKDVTQRANEYANALNRIKPLKTVFNDIALSVARMGSALQSAGNALTRFSAPVRMLMGGAVMGAGYTMLNKVTEGIESGFSRYDTMKKYVAVMNAFGYSMEQAEASKTKLDQSVRGLPTGLDEIMNMAQRFTATVGDLEKGTNLAIAANNAFLASMSTETQQYQGMMQLQDVLGGKDMNAREWNSLVSSMTPAIVKMGESLGYTSKNMSEFIQMIRDGKMANEDFIDTLIKVGTGEGEVAHMAEISKQTYEAFSRNIKNAFSRMGYGILTSLDEIVKLATNGKIETLNKLLIDNVIPAIDNYTESIKGWIQAHPDVILDFFNSVKNIDWKGLATGFVEGIGDIANTIRKLADVSSHLNLSLLGKFFAKSGPIGWFLTVTGGLIKGSRHIIAGIGTLITALVRHFGASGGIGLFGALKRFFGGKNAEKTIKEVPTITGSLRQAFNSLQGVFTIAGAIVTASGTGFVAFKAFKSMMSDLDDIIGIMSRIDWEKGAGALTAMGTFLATFMGLGKLASMNIGATMDVVIGEVLVGAITTLAMGFADLDLALFERSMKHLEGGINALNQSIDLMGKIKEVPGGVATKVSDTIKAMNDIIDIFNGKEGSIKDRGEVKEGLKGFSGTKTKTIENIKSVLDAIISSAESINQINATTLQTGNIYALKANFSTALQEIGKMFDSNTLPAAFMWKDGTNLALDVAGTFENVNKALDFLVGENGVIAKMRKIASDLNASLFIQRATGQISTMLNDLKTAFSSMLVNDGGDYASAATKMNHLANAVESMHTAFKALKKIQKIKLTTKGKNGTGNFKAIANISSLISQLETAFETNRINQLNSQISGFVDTVNDLLEQVQRINKEDGDITIEIHLSDKIYGDKKVISDITMLNNKIKAEIDKIQTYYRKTVVIDLDGSVNKNFRQSGDSWTRQGGDDGTLRATGGMIYRAGGGSIPFFKRRGTDTVPSMLTPGEYVHNKRAVSAFGIDFMRKVNNLDMRGAMNELMHRAGNMANVNRGTHIVNNYNNNQRVVINNSNAGAGFTFKTASRFVGAF